MGKHPKKLLMKIAAGRQILTYVETGLWKGRQLEFATQVFRNVYGIELNPYYVSVVREKLGDRAVILEGSSDVLLPKLVEHEDFKGPVFFYLDAHYCKADPPIDTSTFPLWVELAVIRDRSQKDIILVDDVHTFGKMRPDLQGGAARQQWEDVTEESIMKFMGGDYKTSVISDAFVMVPR